MKIFLLKIVNYTLQNKSLDQIVFIFIYEII